MGTYHVIIQPDAILALMRNTLGVGFRSAFRLALRLSWVVRPGGACLPGIIRCPAAATIHRMGGDARAIPKPRRADSRRQERVQRGRGRARRGRREEQRGQAAPAEARAAHRVLGGADEHVYQGRREGVRDAVEGEGGGGEYAGELGREGAQCAPQQGDRAPC